MTDYKTTDYCRVCGASPDAGEHLPHGHSLLCAYHPYVPPLAIWSGGAQAMSANNAAPPAHVAGAVRVKVEERPGMPQFGVLVGMLLDERGDMQAVVRLDHFGLMLKALHPSKVTPVTLDEEETYKP
jgi:hypothetical protein